jgi:hypothetical protein
MGLLQILLILREFHKLPIIQIEELTLSSVEGSAAAI